MKGMCGISVRAGHLDEFLHVFLNTREEAARLSAEFHSEETRVELRHQLNTFFQSGDCSMGS